MCHKPISELSSEYRDKAREIESLISHRISVTKQVTICNETGANKDKINRLVNDNLDLVASMLAILKLKVVSEDDVYCSKETAEATRELLKNCFNSPDYMRILFK
ncbi:CII family transcriptional regulator [Psychrobacter sp. I-STPA6b]|uniref:CII family transcriptional regulator n=1 Tax=Psychrobacter sp. I-STPA6b TaxID=2585718 RepID=UPI001D0C7C6C|nr:CII family transcriptional regulator [Psychrobacter sp. I-STPA6b]